MGGYSNHRSNRSTNIEIKARALQVVEEQISTASEVRKCFRCGCLHKTVEALAKTRVGQQELAPVLGRARAVFSPKEYDCLGCAVCYPALVANAFAEAFPDEGERLDLCPTEVPVERQGWPPLPGDYHVVRFGAPIAVCALNSASLAADLATRALPGLAITGTLHTENLGIERIIRNILANPNIRFLILCGVDTQQAIGHLPGQSLASLVASGLDERGGIVGARGKRPVLKNINRAQVEAFRRQVSLVSAIGEERVDAVLDQVAACSERNPGPMEGVGVDTGIETVKCVEPRRLVPDPAGFFVIYPEARRQILVVEHYANEGVLDCVLEGEASSALYAAAIERELLSRLDHAAYFGRELARAERSLHTGEPFVQDRAPGNLTTDVEISPCGCGAACAPRGAR